MISFPKKAIEQWYTRIKTKIMKKNTTVIQATIGIVLIGSIVLGAKAYYQQDQQKAKPTLEVTYADPNYNITVEEVELTRDIYDKSDKPVSPFEKKRDLIKKQQNGGTKETNNISLHEVVLTPDQEEQYYGKYPEFQGWNAAYSATQLYLYPDPWGYHSGWDMLVSDDSGEVTRTVVSISIGALTKVSPVQDNLAILDAPIGYKMEHPNITLQLMKVANFNTVDGRRVAKLRKETDGAVKLQYIIDQPADSIYVTIIDVNPINLDVAEKNEQTLDQIVRSFTYIPEK